MTKHLYGLIVTHYGAAANNRGENEGNITTLQKLLWKGEIHTTVSAEAIRWAIRYYWQKTGKPVNRKWNEDKSLHEWEDSNWTGWNSNNGNGSATYIDDDVLGFMDARAAGSEGSDDLDDKKAQLKTIEGEIDKQEKGSDELRTLREQAKNLRNEIKIAGKGYAIKRRGALEVTRAISLTPFSGDITFNAKSGEKSRTSLYGTEVHATRYQYAFAMTPESLKDKGRIYDTIDAIVGLAEVGGNQSRFLYDFSPEAVIFRWTDDFAPRILYGFSQDVQGGISISSIEEKVASKDIAANELIVGGNVRVAYAGIKVEGGIKEAAKSLKERIKIDLEGPRH